MPSSHLITHTHALIVILNLSAEHLKSKFPIIKCDLVFRYCTPPPAEMDYAQLGSSMYSLIYWNLIQFDILLS